MQRARRYFGRKRRRTLGLNGITMKEVSNNHIHLCQSCYKEFQNCDADSDDIMFGDGTGNDNICCCNKYLPIMERDTDRGGYK